MTTNEPASLPAPLLPVGTKIAWVAFTATVVGHQNADVDSPGSSAGYLVDPDDGGRQMWVNAASTSLLVLSQPGSVAADIADTTDVAGDANPQTWPTTDPERINYADWRYQAHNGDTVLGFRDWVDHRNEAEQSYPNT